MKRKISLFTETSNPLTWEYPAKEFIEYHAPFFDEIVVCDAESTDGWREYLATVPNCELAAFKAQELFSTFGQAGKQKGIAKLHCRYPYIVHADVDTFIMGVERLRDFIDQYPDVDTFPMRYSNFYGNFSTITHHMDGSDPYQHTIMKNRPLIGVGKSFPTSDGAEFVYVPDIDEYLTAVVHRDTYNGIYARQSPLTVMNVPVDVMHLNHYGWCCRSLETMTRKMNRQHDTQEKEWGTRPELNFLPQGAPCMEIYTGSHPKPIERLIAAKGNHWRFTP